MQIAKTLWNQRISLHDGVEIAVDVMLPAHEGPFPAVVLRTPYSRGANLKNPNGWLRLIDKGYALVTVDVRGRNDSDGEWIPFVNDVDDAYQVIEWVAEQFWSNNKIGMVGVSYDALTQWWTAAGKPPHLTCIVPLSVGAAYSPRAMGDTGIPMQYLIWWFNFVNGKTVQYPGAPSWENGISHLPLRTLDKHFGLSSSAWQKYVADEVESGSKDASLSDEDFSRIDIPVLIGMGWWDDQTTLSTWMALQQAKSAADCRLLIGAWDHAGNLAPRPVIGGVDVSASMMDTVAYIEQFLATHLKGEKNDLSTSPRCRVFDIGKKIWECTSHWPSPQAVPTPLYLSSEGDARGLNSNGKLSTKVPKHSGQDTYIYDPNQPARDMCNLDRFAWSDPPLDHRYLHRRGDILLYDTAALEKPLALSGRIILRAYISSDRPDTDLYVGINDIHPDGRAIGLFATNEPKGGLRLRYRNGTEAENLIRHQVYEVEVAGPWLHHTFRVGHRLRITVSSNDFPFSTRNAGSGLHWAEDTKLFPQANTLYYGRQLLTQVILPIVEGEKH